MTHPKFTTEQIRNLAHLERMMDKGEIPFVMYDGRRTPMLPAIMDELGLEQGQTVNEPIMVAAQDVLRASNAAKDILASLTKPQSKG